MNQMGASAGSSGGGSAGEMNGAAVAGGVTMMAGREFCDSNVTRTPLARNETRTSFLSTMRTSEQPRKPTVWSPQRYGSCVGLLRYKSAHDHERLLRGNVKGNEWAAKGDANTWSKVKYIYDRIYLRAAETGMTIGQQSLMNAARWLDVNEKNDISMNQYVSILREKYPRRRKR